MRTEPAQRRGRAADTRPMSSEPASAPDPLVPASPLLPVRAVTCFAVSSALSLAVSVVAALTAGGADRGSGPWPDLPGSPGGWLSVLGRWDAAWYLDVAAHGYPDASAFASDPRPAAFYPVLPGLLRSVSALTGLPPVAAGVLVGLLSGLAAVVVLWHLTEELDGPAAAQPERLPVAPKMEAAE